jgi:hypothetical protein
MGKGITDDEWIAQKRADGFRIDDPNERPEPKPVEPSKELLGALKAIEAMPLDPIIPPAHKGRGVRRESGQMNGLEKKYAKRLESLKAAGEILEWHFEAVKLRLAPATFYTPDFLVMLADCTIELHETKGYWEEDAKVKVKVAASLFPFVFRTVRHNSKTGWQIHEVTGKLKS